MIKLLKKTTPNFLGAIVGALLFFVLPYLISGSYEVYQDYKERNSSQEEWFKYYSIDPISPIFRESEDIVFTSKTEYFKDIDIVWQDTQYCLQGDVRKKYPTQVWPEEGSERKTAGTTVGFDPEIPDTWEYIYKPDGSASSCQLQSVVIGTTPRGYEKVYEHIGDYYRVNVQ